MNFEIYIKAILGELHLKFSNAVLIELDDCIWATGSDGTKLVPFYTGYYFRFSYKDWNCTISHEFIEEKYDEEYPVDLVANEIVEIINKNFIGQLYKEN